MSKSGHKLTRDERRVIQQLKHGTKDEFACYLFPAIEKLLRRGIVVYSDRERFPQGTIQLAEVES